MSYQKDPNEISVYMKPKQGKTKPDGTPGAMYLDGFKDGMSYRLTKNKKNDGTYTLWISKSTWQPKNQQQGNQPTQGQANNPQAPKKTVDQFINL